MNKFYIFLLLAFSGAATAQEGTASNGSVEKSLFNVQTGSVGLWVSNEARLADKWALRTEIGLDLWTYEAYTSGTMGTVEDKGTILVPSISLEPRWYYNIEKRSNKGKKTANNSANFVTVAVEYFPDLFTIGSKPDFVYVPNQISFIPKWGIRRSIADSNFNYELGLGVGYQVYLEEADDMKTASDVAVDLHIRIGYTF